MFDLFSRNKINQCFSQIEEINEILPFEKLVSVYHIYSVDVTKIVDLPENNFNDLIMFLEGIVLSFEKHVLYLTWDCDKDEVGIDLKTETQYPLNQVFQLNNDDFVLSDVSQTKFWKNSLNKPCDWIWVVINSFACVDSIQLSFDNMRQNIQVMALGELRLFKLKETDKKLFLRNHDLILPNNTKKNAQSEEVTEHTCD